VPNCIDFWSPPLALSLQPFFGVFMLNVAKRQFKLSPISTLHAPLQMDYFCAEKLDSAPVNRALIEVLS